MSTAFYTLFTIFTHVLRLLLSGKVATVKFNLKSIHAVFLLHRNPTIGIPRLQCADHDIRCMKGVRCLVLLYDLASKKGLMSLMPCSAATAMMWFRAFMLPNSFTTSLTWSLLAEIGHKRHGKDKVCGVFLVYITPTDGAVTKLNCSAELLTLQCAVRRQTRPSCRGTASWPGG